MAMDFMSPTLETGFPGLRLLTGQCYRSVNKVSRKGGIYGAGRRGEAVSKIREVATTRARALAREMVIREVNSRPDPEPSALETCFFRAVRAESAESSHR